jgi:TetR/AcrR family transcriptional regulator, transcriptional repressor for nem operon
MGKSDTTRQYIIEKTAPVFNKHGFDGATLGLLQEATGLTKGSLYGNFSDKQEIAKAAFRYSMERVREFVGGKVQYQKSAKQKLLALLTFYSDYVFNPPIAGGCPLLNNAVEADDHHTFMKKTVASEIDKTISFISSLLEDGKKNGEFRKDIKCAELATIFFSSIEGAIMVSRVSGSDAAMKSVFRHCKYLLDTISNE